MEPGDNLDALYMDFGPVPWSMGTSLMLYTWTLDQCYGARGQP